MLAAGSCAALRTGWASPGSNPAMPTCAERKIGCIRGASVSRVDTARDTSPVIEFMVTFGIADRLLAEHVNDDTGHCRGCASPRPVFPCLTRVYAVRASEVEHRRDAARRST